MRVNEGSTEVEAYAPSGVLFECRDTNEFWIWVYKEEFNKSSNVEILDDVNEFVISFLNTLEGEFTSWREFDLSWFVKKNFFEFHNWLFSKKLKFCNVDGVEPNVVSILFELSKELRKLLFWKKDKVNNSLVFESCVNFDELQMFWDVFRELCNVFPIKFLTCVKWNKLVVVLFERIEFFKSHRFCLDWFKFL